MKIRTVDDIKVYLIAGGGKCYTDIAAKFCRSKKSVPEIIASDYNKKLVEKVLKSGHLAATEFDFYIFGIEGVSRVFEAQLIRKRMASYMISSGREENDDWEMTLPTSAMLAEHINVNQNGRAYSLMDILNLIERWYEEAIHQGIPAESARYLMPQGTTKKIVLAMNIHGLLDWFKIRCCNRSQLEIRTVAWKILNICKETQPDLFADAGPSCKALGFCPEMEQCEQLKGKVLPLEYVKKAVKEGRFHIDK